MYGLYFIKVIIVSCSTIYRFIVCVSCRTLFILFPYLFIITIRLLIVILRFILPTRTFVLVKAIIIVHVALQVLTVDGQRVPLVLGNWLQ